MTSAAMAMVLVFTGVLRRWVIRVMISDHWSATRATCSTLTPRTPPDRTVRDGPGSPVRDRPGTMCP